MGLPVEVFTSQAFNINIVSSVLFSPGEEKFAATAAVKKTIIYDTNTVKELVSLNAYSQENNSLNFSPNGKRIITSSHNGHIKIWDASTGEELLSFIDPSKQTTCTSLSPDGERIASAGWEKIDIWVEGSIIQILGYIFRQRTYIY